MYELYVGSHILCELHPIFLNSQRRLRHIVGCGHELYSDTATAICWDINTILESNLSCRHYIRCHGEDLPMMTSDYIFFVDKSF